MSYQNAFKEIERYAARAQKKEKFSFESTKPFHYVVSMFPYPSGNIHMGHIRNYTISSVIANYKKSKGFNVLHPMGFDSFGLPAESAAIKHGVTPFEWTSQNIEKMRGDFDAMNFGFDSAHTLVTHEFDYYRFEQDLFKKAWAKKLIYKKEKYVNYDPVDKTILSNEQVHNGRGWRSGAAVIRKKIPMFFFDMRRYAHELSDSLTDLPQWPTKVKEMQKNWIGIIKGKELSFDFPNFELKIFDDVTKTAPKVVVLGVNHEFVAYMMDKIEAPMFEAWLERENRGSVSKKDSHAQTAWFDTGFSVMHNHTTMPVYIDVNRDEEALFVSHDFQSNEDEKMGEKIGLYKNQKDADFIGLKDWCISRQRYWGSPIPVVHCSDCGDVPSEGYVELPQNLLPQGTGNVLDKTPSFYECLCPQCGKNAARSTDTMDTFVQSAWYYQRYIDPQSPEMIPRPETQIDTYIGGVEHATMHLIYARFFHKMLRDLGYLSTSEPIKKLITQGMVCKKYTRPDGTVASAKMSKSLGNVVAPGDYIEKYGSDAVKMFIIFAAPPSDNFDFEDAAMVGTFRFLEEVYRYFLEENTAIQNIQESQCEKTIDALVHYVDKEFEGRGNLNTVVPQLMMAFKTIKKTHFESKQKKEILENQFLTQLGIFAPSLSYYILDHRAKPQLAQKPKM